MSNQKGHVHLYAISGVALLIFIGYGLINKYGLGSSDRSSNRPVSVSYGEQQGEPAQEVTGTVGDQRLNEMLYNIADTQSSLLRMKVETIAASWPSLDTDAQFRILRSFRADTEKRQAEVQAILNRFNAPEWKQSAGKREKHLAELMLSISEEQCNPQQYHPSASGNKISQKSG